MSSSNDTPGQGPMVIEIGRLWLHLPTGRAGIVGFVRNAHGGPDCGPLMRRDRPVHEGGHQTLFEGLDPVRPGASTGVIVDLRTEPPRFDTHGFNWAGRTTSDAQAAAERLGWQTITRTRAAELLHEAGYTLHERTGPDGTRYFHDELYLDQVDGLTWHVRESIDGTRFVSERCVFVTREIPLTGQFGLDAARTTTRDQ